jgi:O-antigen/teichoic acid export membrane protein
MKIHKTNEKVIIKNSFLDFIGKFVPLIFAFIAIPVIIRGLGPTRFGILALAWTVLGYFSIFNLGIGRASTKFVAEAIGNNNEKIIPEIIWVSIFSQIFFGILCCLAIIFFADLIVNNIIKIPESFVPEAEKIFKYVAISIPLVQFSSSLRGILQAAQRFDLVNVVDIPGKISTYILPLIGLYFKLDLPGIVLLLLLSKLFVAVILFIFNAYVFPGIIKIPRFQMYLFRRVVIFGGWISLSGILGTFFNYFDRFLIASLGSVSTVTYYVAPHEIISKLAIIPSSITSALFPAFSYHGLDNKKIITEMFARPIKYLFLIMVPILMVILIFSNHFLSFWLGAEFAEKSTLVLQILAVSFFLNAIGFVPFTALHGLGRPDLKAKLDLFQVPIFLILCFLLIPKMGIVGAALAKLVTQTVDLVFLFILVKNIAHVKYRNIFPKKIVYSSMIFFLLMFLAVVYAGDISNLIFELSLAIVCSGIYICYFIYHIMDEKDYEVYAYFRDIFFKKLGVKNV